MAAPGAEPGDGDGGAAAAVSLTAVVREGATAFFLVDGAAPGHPPLLASAVVGFDGVATLDDVRVPAGAPVEPGATGAPR